MPEITLKPGKIIFSVPDESYTFQLLDINNLEPSIVIYTTILTYNSIISTRNKFKNVTDIEINNNNNITITDSEGPLNSLIVNKGTLTLHNNYEGKIKTDINIGNNSILTQKGKNLPIKSITLNPQAQFIFTLDQTEYSFHNPKQLNNETTTQWNSDSKITINNIHKLAYAAVSLQSENYTLKELIIYTKSTKFSLFLQQNNITINKNAIDSYIDNNYFALTGIAKSLSNSIGLPNEIVVKIVSYLKLSDIKPPVSQLSSNNIDETHTEFMGDVNDLI